MGIVSIPVRLTAAEIAAVALAEAADALAAAGDPQAFATALDSNRRLWLTVSEVARRRRWRAPDRRTADFVMAATRYAGRGVQDDHVERLIGFNREVSTLLADGRQLAPIRARAVLAWQEGGKPLGLRLDRWLIAEIDRKGRFPGHSA